MDDLSAQYSGQRILVTGGAGAIGGNLVRRLADLPTELIVILDNFSSAYRWNVPTGPKIQLIEGDILDDEKLKCAFKEQPHIVFHLAAHFANQNSVDNPETDLMVNGLGILKMLQYAQLTGVERFVYS
ncbi:MAG: NAD-dependent epimerase/dehydratase family protein, partial [Halobacteriota archaeon]